MVVVVVLHDDARVMIPRSGVSLGDGRGLAGMVVPGRPHACGGVLDRNGGGRGTCRHCIQLRGGTRKRHGRSGNATKERLRLAAARWMMFGGVVEAHATGSRRNALAAGAAGANATTNGESNLKLKLKLKPTNSNCNASLTYGRRVCVRRQLRL